MEEEKLETTKELDALENLLENAQKETNAAPKSKLEMMREQAEKNTGEGENISQKFREKFTGEQIAPTIVYENRQFSSYHELGDYLLTAIGGEYFDEKRLIRFVTKGALTKYLKAYFPDEQELLMNIKKQRLIIKGKYKAYSKTIAYYLVGFYLSSSGSFTFEDNKYENLDEFENMLADTAKSSIFEFQDKIKKLCPEEKTLDPFFEAWLYYLGKQDIVEKWKKEIV